MSEETEKKYYCDKCSLVIDNFNETFNRFKIGNNTFDLCQNCLEKHRDDLKERLAEE